MKVITERYVQQVTDGTHYSGHVTFGGTRLEYDLKLGISIKVLDDTEVPDDIKNVRRLMMLTIKKDDRDIELSDQEYGFFISLLLQLVVDFYHNPQTRHANSEILNQSLGTPKIMNAMGASYSIGITSDGTYDLPENLCNMLNDPKFGCKLAA